MKQYTLKTTDEKRSTLNIHFSSFVDKFIHIYMNNFHMYLLLLMKLYIYNTK